MPRETPGTDTPANPQWSAFWGLVFEAAWQLDILEAARAEEVAEDSVCRQ